MVAVAGSAPSAVDCLFDCANGDLHLAGYCKRRFDHGGDGVIVGALFFVFGLGACYVIGRHLTRYADIAQGGAVGVCGVAGLIFGLPALWADQFLWSLGLLFVYGVVGSFVFRQGRKARGIA